ncbi:MAG: hypothetical protein WC538_18670 [Thermoanaerobaculia bacterium]|jgi:hypothetical protein
MAFRWFILFIVTQFATWATTYFPLATVEDSTRASAHPWLLSSVVTIFAVMCYGIGFLRGWDTRNRRILEGDEEALIAKFKTELDRRWTSPSFFWRFVFLASLPALILAVLLSGRRSGLSVVIPLGLVGPLAAGVLWEFGRFVRAVTAKDRAT